MPDLSLAARVSALDPYRIVMQPGTSARIATGGGADWFGPLDPLAPIAPKDVAGRQFDYPPGYNLVTQPRAYEPIGFWDLRALADAYDLIRAIIETRKDQMARLEWAVRPRDPKARLAPGDGRVAAIEAFLRRPDGVHAWDAWLRQLLEDLFVIDAPSLWAERTRDGRLARLHPIDGATIKRVIDDWGRTPSYPLPAYQQVLHGLPAVDYTTRDIIYRPRNMRVHKVYGFSPVEQILVTVNIALRRQVFQLQYYTEGNVPEALIGTPEDWTPEQIERFQLYWDGLNAGNTAQRRHAKFVPGGVAKTFIPTKDQELTGATDEWLARIVCFAFSVSPQPFTRLMNRATAETAQDASLAEGLAPIRQWVKQLVDDVIEAEFAAPDLEFRWQDDRATDPVKVASIAADYVQNGIKSVNEVRGELGLDPVPGGEVPVVLTAQGPVRLGAAGAAQDAVKFARLNPIHYGPGPQGGQFEPKGADGTSADHVSGNDGGDGGKGRQLSYDDVANLVRQNNQSKLVSDELAIAIAYKESGFDPTAESSDPKSTARGLMGMTDGAMNDLRQRAGWTGDTNLFDPAENIRAATAYLELRINDYGGDSAEALAHYGTGQAYASQLLRAEAALQAAPSDPVAALARIVGKR